MELAEAYHTLYDEVRERTDGLDETRKHAFSSLPESGLSHSDSESTPSNLSGLDMEKIRVNDQELAEELEEYGKRLKRFNEIGNAIDRRFGDTLYGSRDGLVEDLKQPSKAYSGHRFSLGEEFKARRDQSLDQWVLNNVDPILEANNPDEFRELIRTNARTNESYPDLEATYEGLEKFKDEGIYEGLFPMMSAPTLDDEQVLSIEEALQERRQLSEEVAEYAADLEGRLQDRLSEQLDAYNPSFGQRVGRRIDAVLG